MRVDVLGEVGVVDGERAITGLALGGRRAHVALVALALAEGGVAADALARTIWGEELPPTWAAGLRGVIRGLRTAVPDSELITTVPSGYRLADGVDVDIAVAAGDLRRAAELTSQGRHAAAMALAEPVSRMSGDQLLPQEEGEWLTVERRAVGDLALQGLELLTAAASALGEHGKALVAARRAVAAAPLDERAHRALIVALDRSGDRAGAVQAFESCRSVLSEELGVDPSSATVQAYLAALRDQRPTSVARVPASTSTFVGREAEFVALRALLGEPGLVSVAGRGGVGKSRLVAETATSLELPGGRLWVPLAAVAQDALVAATVALQLGVAIGNDEPAAALVEHLAPLGRGLLVLDGCEQVIDGVASLAVQLLVGCPGLTLVVTTRVPLAVDGEQVLRVEPLADTELQVRLLVDRVRDGGGDVVIDELVPLLLRRCGGLPLALELVAAQLTALPVGDLLDHLSGSVEDGDDRLREIAESSYALLDEDERAVFRRLAVLDGAAGLPLVRQVVAGGSVSELRVVRLLRELTARGLLGVDRSGARWRYQQDDDLHRYAGELLFAAGEEGTAYGRLADAVRAALPEDARASPLSFQADLSDMLGSVRSLFAAGLDGRADPDRCLELAFRLHRYFAATHVEEGRFWLSRLLAVGVVSPWTPHATYALGYLSYWSGNTMEAIDRLTEAVEAFEGIEDAYAARALIYLAGLLDDLDRAPEAVGCIARAIAAAAPFDTDLQVSAAMGMGSILAERGDPAAAGYARDAIELCRRGGSAEQLAVALPTAAMVSWQVGAYDQCREYVDESRPMHVDSRRIARVVLLSTSAGLALSEGDLDSALDFGVQADHEATDLGVEREAPLIRAVLARTLLARGDVAASAERALSALDAAVAMEIVFPLAICFETAALVAGRLGAVPEELAGLLATAAVLRARGDRLPLPSLSGALDDLGVGLPVVEPLELETAVALVRQLLGQISPVPT